MDRALIIQRKWLHNIFHNGKVWEMRSSPTRIRGKIGLIEAGSGLILGECNLVNSLSPIETIEQAKATIGLHRIDDFELLKKWKYPWQLSGIHKYKKPKKYKHPRGAVIWVRL